MTKEKILLVYDKECPACNFYCQLVRIEESVGELVIVNARDEHAVIHEITQLGLDIDQGMVLKLGNNIYYGAQAINALALISSRSGFFNRFNYWVFKSKALSFVLYPVLKLMRNLLLKMLRVKKINNLDNDQRSEYF